MQHLLTFAATPKHEARNGPPCSVGEWGRHGAHILSPASEQLDESGRGWIAMQPLEAALTRNVYTIRVVVGVEPGIGDNPLLLLQRHRDS